MESHRQIVEEESALESCLKMADIPESELLPHFHLRSLIQLTRTNHGIHGLFKERRLREVLMDALMAHLADIIVNKPTNENIDELKKILSVYPELLTRKIKKVIYQQTGQAYLNYSLLQLAFAEGDDDLCHDVLKPCFERAFGHVDAAREEIRKQLNEKFPAGNEEKNQRRAAEDLSIKNLLASLLAAVIQAITNEQFNLGKDAENKWILSPITLAAIATFRSIGYPTEDDK